MAAGINPPAGQVRPIDRLDQWIDAGLAARLRRAGLETLNDLLVAAASGRRWWFLAPSIGPRRAQAILATVKGLLPGGE
ncbi:hypothetical protein HLB44_30835 [Aquincola sp. S2]|uniref:RNA polymerase alpha subunit C-terminal domain-containing protein n=1 Tax=Pseudaquabacterium terrae TaxID=2732868 RepID=A0ABX2ERT1_9BURK|nr:hypothetical protein [Aquabacterium terrae]